MTDDLERWYGAWEPVRPADVAARLGDFAGPWWIAGGWAVEAFTGVRRTHVDVDVAIFRNEADALRRAVAGRLMCWSVFDGALAPFTEERGLHPDADQLWLRADATSPWSLEVLLNPGDAGAWVNRRLPSHTAPLADVTWVGPDGVRYLAPEVALLFKAKYAATKDEHDLDAALPLLGAERRAWLAEHLAAVHPGHGWLDRLG